MKKAKFITIEGGEGVGKTLFVKLLVTEIKNCGISVMLTREPGGTPIADKLREIFISPSPEDPLLVSTEFCIVSAARAQHVGKKIMDALNKDIWVVCDRFADSSRVYQGFIGGIPEADIEYIINFSTFGIEPDLTFLLDCPVEISLSRLQNRKFTDKTKLSRFDSKTIEFHNKVREGFLKLQSMYPQRIKIINAANTIDDMVNEALVVVKKQFGL